MPKRPYSLEIKQRFVQAVELISQEKNLKESDIAISVGMSQSNFYRVKTSDKNYPTLDHCALLCEKYKVSASWLLLGRGIIRDVSIKNISPLDMIKEAVKMMEAKRL